MPNNSLLGVVAAERYTRQIVSLGTSVPTYDNPAGAVSVPIAWPALAGTVAANVKTFMSIALKPGTANLGNVPTPAGWTLVASHIGGGYGGVLGLNTGNVRIYLFSKDNDNTNVGNLVVPITPDGASGVACGCMSRIEKLKGAWEPVVISKGDATVNGTNVANFTPTPPMPVSRGDFLIYGFAITDYFVGGTALNSGPSTDLGGAAPSLALGTADQFGFTINNVETGRRAKRGLAAIADPQIHTAPIGINNRGPMVIARYRVR